MENLVNLNIKFWHNKKIIITGHTGFKGAWLSLILSIFGSKVYGYSLKPNREQKLFKLFNLQNKLMDSKFANILDYNSLKKFCKKVQPDIIIHMASQSLVIDAYKNPRINLETNIQGTVNLLDVSDNLSNLKVFINVTTDKVYQESNSKYPFKEIDILNSNEPYGISKVCSDLITQSYNSFKQGKTKYCVVRSGNVIGGGDFSKNRIVPDIIRSYNSNSKLNIRNPDHIRPWQHVFEPLNGYLKVIEYVYDKKITKNLYSWNFGPKKNSFISVLKLIEKFNNLKKLKYTFNSKYNYKENSYLALNSNKAKELLNWSNYLTLDQIIKSVLEWNDIYLKNNQKEIELLSINHVKDYFLR